VRINDVSLSLGEFQDMLERQPLEGKMKLLSQRGREIFLKITSSPERCFIRSKEERLG